MSQQLRYEIKFPLDAVTPAAVAYAIAASPAGFRELYPERVINNVYFDSPRLDAYRASVEGLSERAKLRLRWYGAELGDRAVMELKRRRGAGGWKTKLPVSLPVAAQLEARQLLDTLRPQLAEMEAGAQRLLSCLSLANRYRRAYYISRDGRCRLTVDRDLELRPLVGGPLRGGDSLRGGGPRLRGPSMVIEIKADIGDREALERATQALPYRPRRFSKYTAGVGQLLARQS